MSDDVKSPRSAYGLWSTPDAHPHYGPAPYNQVVSGGRCVAGGGIISCRLPGGEGPAEGQRDKTWGQRCVCDRTHQITLQVPDQGKRPPEQWTVTDPYARTDHTFELAESALLYAVDNARPDRPTVIRRPGGQARFILMAEDPRVTLQAVRNLTGPATRPTMPPEPAEASVQALAGARLFYALYYHPRIYPELMGKDGPLSGVGFMKAYMSAQRAFLPDEGARLPEGWYQRDGVQEPLADLESRCIQQGREEAAEAIMERARVNGIENVPEGMSLSWQAAAALAAGRPVELNTTPGQRGAALIERLPDEARDNLIAQGRREAAEAIRSQARMFGVTDVPEGMSAGMMSWQAAAALAEGSTGVQNGEGS